MSGFDELATAIVEHRRRLAIVAVLVVTLVLGSAVPDVRLSTSLESFRGGTDEAAAEDFIESEMSGGVPNTTEALIVIRDEDNVLTKETYLNILRAQKAMLANETINSTLAHRQRPLSLANAVAIIAIERANGTPLDDVEVVEHRPPLDAQIRAVKNLTTFTTDLYTTYAIDTVLDQPEHTWPPGGAFAFVPTSYEPRGKTANVTTIVVSHQESTDPRDLTAAQLAMADVVNEQLPDAEAIVIGDGIVNAELRRSALDSLVLVTPAGFLFILLVLLVAYRDLLDVALGLFGVGVVLVWTFGYLGWVGIPFNMLFVAVPILLMGLSIDLALQLVMRYREERETFGTAEDRRSLARTPDEARGVLERVHDRGMNIRAPMTVALAGVGVAFVLDTLAAAVGFLSNLVSDVPAIRQFGVMTAVGITSALIIFGVLIPALKVEFDEFLAARGYDRHKRSIGSDGGVVTSLLAGVVATVRVAPWGVIALALLATAAGTYGATQISTDFERDDLLVSDEEIPAWTEDLPEPFAPGNYTAQENLNYVEERNIIYEGTVTEILVRGDITQADTLVRLQRAMDRANHSDVVLITPRKHPATTSVLTLMNEVASFNESFAQVLERADTNGDGVPDRNIEHVYDEFYAAAPEAASTMVYRENGEYRALRIVIPVNGSATAEQITVQIRSATAPVEGDGLRAIATGQPIMNQAVSEALLDTVIQSLVVTFLVILALLLIAYHLTAGRASLGVVTVLPVLFAVAWIVGTMHLLGIPFNVTTALITSLTIGLGVDYSIHLSERYIQEFDQRGDAGEALRRSVLGTGSALLGSAAATAGGFGVLAFAILEPLQQFGVITALTIVYSAIATVFVLPGLLVVWTRWVPGTSSETATASPGD